MDISLDGDMTEFQTARGLQKLRYSPHLSPAYSDNDILQKAKKVIPRIYHKAINAKEIYAMVETALQAQLDNRLKESELKFRSFSAARDGIILRRDGRDLRHEQVHDLCGPGTGRAVGFGHGLVFARRDDLPPSFIPGEQEFINDHEGTAAMRTAGSWTVR
jgi:hypothetical protein